MPTSSGRPLVLALGAAALLVLTGCSSASSGSSSSAPAEPSSATTATAAATGASLVVYSGRDEELIAPLIEQFTTASGITVDTRYAGTTELAAQLLEEGDATPAQVFLSQDAGALGAISEAGLFAPLPEAVTSLVDPALTARDGTWVGLTGRTRVVVYDSENVTADEAPSDVFDLLDPKWNGRIAIAPTNASFQTFVTALRVQEGEERAREWLEGLVANDVQIFDSNSAILEAVNSGAVDLGLINHYYWARSEQDPTTLRAQLKFGDPGSTSALVNVTGAGILKGAAESPEATAFVEFLVSEEAQRYFLEETFEYPLVGELPGPEGLPALSDLGRPDIDLSSLSSLDTTVALITEVGLI